MENRSICSRRWGFRKRDRCDIQEAENGTGAIFMGAENRTRAENGIGAIFMRQKTGQVRYS